MNSESLPEDLSNKRILLVGPEINRQGGIATICRMLISGWDYSSYQMKYITTIKNGSIFLQPITFSAALIRLIYLLIFWRPQLVHSHFSWKGSFARKSIILLIAKTFRVKVILHCNSSRFDVFYSENNNYVKTYIRFILNLADLLIVVSKQWQEYFESLQLNTPIKVLPNPAQIPIKPQRANGNVVNILTLGRLGKRKGSYDILEAVPLILEANPDTKVHFWLGGDGDVEQIQKIINQNNLNEHVQLLGWITGQEKEKVLAAAHIFLLPTYHEGLPLAILEAMAWYLPVVSTPVGGIPEVLTNEETGLIVEPGNIDMIIQSVNRLVKDVDFRTALGNQANTYVRTHVELNLILTRLFCIYDELRV